MDDVAGIRAVTMEDYKSSFKQLEWVSSEARRILLGRHFARNLGRIEVAVSENLLDQKSIEKFLLSIFRGLSTSLAPKISGSAKFSAPYDPPRAPTMFFMAFNRGARLAALEFVDKAGPMQPITHWYIEHAALDKVNHFASSSSVDAIDQIFFFELKKNDPGDKPSQR